MEEKCKILEVTVRYFDNGQFRVEIYEQESGDYNEIDGNLDEPTNFEHEIAEEISSWASIIREELEDEEE